MGKTVKFASSFVYNDNSRSSSRSSNNNNNNNAKDTKAKQSEDDADVNIIALELGQISQQQSEPITGDPLFCSNVKCKAIFNSTSQLANTSAGKVWTCEFCGQSTPFQLDEAEVPKLQEADYVLEPVLAASSGDDSMIIFCIDTSGSMCVTSEYVSTEPPKPTPSSLSKFVERGASQKLPNQKSNVQYISRLQSVQAAVSAQIEALHKTFPQKRLGIVIFNDDVQILGDGTKDPVSVAGDKLDNYDELVSVGSNFSMDSGVEKTKNQLLSKVKTLEEQGGTALGPALLVSCAIANKRSGSKVIICTDGLANIGLGSMDDTTQIAKQSAFYDQIAQFAKEGGTTVSVLTIAGNECSLENIGRVADITGGDVSIVDPQQIAANFANILQKPVIATNVTVTLVAHPGIAFSNGSSVIKSDIGNITADSEITHGFSVVPERTQNLKSIPFQVQIGYRRTNGPLCVRVITTEQAITSDRNLAEKDVDVLVVGVHVSKKSASLVQEGQYEEARENAMKHKRLLERAVKTKEQRELMSQFEATLNVAENELRHVAQTEEIALRGVNLDSLDLSEQRFVRSQARSDRTAEYMYQMKGEKAAGCVIQ